MVGLALTTFPSCSDNEAQPFDEPEVNSDTLCYVTVPDTAKTLTAERAMMIAARLLRPDVGSCCLGTEFDTSISIFRVSDARFDIFVHYSDV